MNKTYAVYLYNKNKEGGSDPQLKNHNILEL